MSRFGGIETSGFAIVKGIAGFNETKLVGAAVLTSYTPAAYPAAVCAMLNPTKMKESTPPSNGHVSIRFRCEFGIVVWANSDGQELGDARTSAWSLVDAVIDAFTNPAWTVPASQIDGATCWPIDIGAPLVLDTEPGKLSIYVSAAVEIEWRT